MVTSKLLKAAGRFGVRYGQLVKRRIANIENRQRKKQQCLFCNGRAKRLSKGIWQCNKCGKKFASHAYYLDNAFAGYVQKPGDAKPLKSEPTNKKKERKSKKSETK